VTINGNLLNEIRIAERVL